MAPSAPLSAAVGTTLSRQGTKQGGILSPDFFALYINELITILKRSGYGCYIIRVCIACIFFADDMVLLSPSQKGSAGNVEYLY